MSFIPCSIMVHDLPAIQTQIQFSNSIQIQCRILLIFSGFTPLMYAAENGNVDCMKALLDYGASVKFQVSISCIYL